MKWDDDALLERMTEGWCGGLREGTPCGSGSLKSNTANARKALPYYLDKYKIKSVCDAGAGDLYWAQDVFLGRDYRPFDLIPQSPSVVQVDITKTALPKCDAIICRLVLIHLDPPRIHAALKLFRQSARYLFASQYPVLNRFDADKDFNRTNLIEPPYNLGIPLEVIRDGGDRDCSLCLWDLSC